MLCPRMATVYAPAATFLIRKQPVPSVRASQNEERLAPPASSRRTQASFLGVPKLSVTVPIMHPPGGRRMSIFVSVSGLTAMFLTRIRPYGELAAGTSRCPPSGALMVYRPGARRQKRNVPSLADIVLRR